jgi:hypothetical protein
MIEPRAPWRERIGKWYHSLPPGFWHIVVLVIVSRIIITFVGMFARLYIPDQNPDLMQFSSLPFLDVWGRWDSTWYYLISIGGYVKPIMYAWYPFYPLLIRAVTFIVRDAFIAGLVVSNVALVIACVYLYKLACLDVRHDAAMRSVRYMLLWPTAFVLSAVLTESTFLALTLAAFYYARKDKWLLVGVLGCCMALTRIIGVFMILPLEFIYFKRLYVPPRSIDIKKVRPDILSLLLMPLGALGWVLFNYVKTGDPFAFFHVQTIWHRYAAGVIKVLTTAFSGSANEIVWASCGIAALVVLVVFVRKMPFAYWLYSMLVLLVPLSTGTMSVPRYTLVIFPYFILLGTLAKSRRIDIALSVILALLQIVCMMYWGTWVLA